MSIIVRKNNILNYIHKKRSHGYINTIGPIHAIMIKLLTYLTLILGKKEQIISYLTFQIL